MSKKATDIVKITQRAAETLKAIQTVNSTDEKHVLRIDIEGQGYSLWLGPQQKGDTWVGSEDSVLLRVTPGMRKLLRETSMVIDCMEYEGEPRLIVYPADNPPPELSKTNRTRRAAQKTNKR